MLTAANYVFPFIVYPYVARVLGPDNIGACNFVDGIVNYACALSLMGAGAVGVRTIAKYRGDPVRLSEGFTAVVSLSGAFTLVASAALLIVTFYLPQVSDAKELMFVGQIKLWANFFLLEWLYKGLEDFRYITLRTIIVRCVYVAAIFLFVRAKSDYVVYFLLLALADAVNSAINCFCAMKVVRLRFSMAAVKEVAVPFLALGVYLILNAMYTTFNVIYLGSVTSDAQVGYYTTATKAFNIVLAMYTAYSVVIMPRACSLLSRGEHDEFRRLIGKSVDALMMFAVPASIFCMLYSVGIVGVIGGEQYYAAVWPMVIVMPLLFVIGYEQILVVQILTPLANDKVILANSILGASVGVVGNLLLVRWLEASGAALVWLCAELAVLTLAQHFVKKYTAIGFPWKKLLKNLAAYVPYAVVSVAILLASAWSPIAKMLCGAALLCAYIMLAQHVFLKNPLYGEFSGKILGYLKTRKA